MMIVRYGNDVNSSTFSKEEEIGDDELRCIISILSCNWGKMHEKYKTEKSIIEGEWRCTYSVKIYDAVSCCVYGYGKTDEEAYSNCKSLLNRLKSKHESLK